MKRNHNIIEIAGELRGETGKDELAKGRAKKRKAAEATPPKDRVISFSDREGDRGGMLMF